ncbi:OprD family outer membrane porin [Azorhizophilus paspali]|uniref:OprD family outer membrane porin n=1 Tax=Azorhizophilus paspali TaxID=69963 RepID=UPI0036385406
MLPGGYNNRAPDDYSELGVTSKVCFSKTEIKVGTLLPKNPVLLYNDTRLLPQTFQGGNLQIKEIEGL